MRAQILEQRAALHTQKWWVVFKDRGCPKTRACPRQRGLYFGNPPPPPLGITSCKDHGGFSKNKVLKKPYVLPQNRGTFQQQNFDLFCGGTIMPYNKASINTKKKWAGLYIFSKYLFKELNNFLLSLFSINFQDFDKYLAAYFVPVDLIQWHKMSRELQNDPNIPSKIVIISKSIACLPNPLASQTHAC